MATLPVREMVLYKHGVGFFVREGNMSGELVALTFRQDEINDVLKSLAVFDRSGGQVLGIHYQTPMDKDARLASSSIRLSDTSSMRDLVVKLRGRLVEAYFEVSTGVVETVNGRMVGLDAPPLYSEKTSVMLDEHLVSILADDGQVRVFRLSALRALRIEDAQSEHDLSYFLDTSMSEDVRRTVNVRLSEGEHQLVVYYVAPSPTWRVSYRLVAELDENEENGKALLQGWGLFDNRLEEDLDNVRVTLVAGQPISFIYELYASRIPERPLVEDESRVAPGPIEFAGGAVPYLADFLEDAEVAYAASIPAPAPKARAITGTHYSREQMMQSTPPAAEATESGEFFQYAVTAPVSVKRGASALVPIIGAEVSYQRELLYNKAKLPDHPVAALRFVNNTGLTLERGPVTIVENGDYKGEAVVAFTKDANSIYLPYAVELGIKVVERQQHHTVTTGLSIQQQLFIYEMYNVQATTYTLENTTAKEQTVMIEAPILTDWEVFDSPVPEVTTLKERRWRVSIPAHGKTELIIRQRMRTYRREEIRRLDKTKLAEIMRNHWLNEGINKLLADILDNLGRIQQAESKLGGLKTERDTQYKRQEQLRANLGSLQSAGQEAALRNRMLGQLEQSQDRLEAIEKETSDLQYAISEAERRIDEIIAALSVKKET